MYEKFLELKKNKRWLFWILIVPFLIVAFLEFYKKYLINSGKKAVKDAEKKDEKLSKKQKETQELADYHKKQADNIEKQIENIKTDKEWHLK